MLRLIKATTSAVLFAVLISPAWSYDSRCLRITKNLRYAAQEYESALSAYEDAKSSYESECDFYSGYSDDYESECEPDGYLRLELEDALETLQSAESGLKDAYDDVIRRCKPPNSNVNSAAMACYTALSQTKKELSACLSKMRD